MASAVSEVVEASSLGLSAVFVSVSSEVCSTKNTGEAEGVLSGSPLKNDRA